MNNEIQRQSVLKVEQSFSKKNWVFKEANEDDVAILSQSKNLPEFIARMLVQRGVKASDIEGFLNPTLRHNFPDPFSMKGMEEFAEELADAIINQKSIGILADFDVDGATSSGIMARFLRHCGIDAPIYIPDRLTEGYGPSVGSMQSLKDQGCEYVLMLDCGITSFEPLEAAEQMGVKVCVFDHHEPEGELPKAKYVVNPKRHDDKAGLEMLAACGVTFMACVALNKKLREKDFFQDRDEAPLKNWLDLVALGTVCDMVPLKGVNRLFVKSGFAQMGEMNNPGIKALCQVSNIENLPEPKDAGWSLGPRINAGSRVHRSDLGSKLLSTDDYEEAQSIAWALEDCNQERRKIQSEMMKVAENKIAFLKAEHENFILVDDESFHSGLSGLVAGRLKDKYSKPAIVVTYVENENGEMEGRGSGRSIPGVNMADLFISARNENILVKGGGHAMAGGFTIMPNKLDEFKNFISSYIESHKTEDTKMELEIDSIASVRAAKTEFIKIIHHQMGPFGVGNEEPVFALPDVRVHDVSVLKEKHIRLLVSDSEGGTRMKVMFFYGVDTPMGNSLIQNYRETLFHLVGQFQINSWQGRESVEFHLKDGAAVFQSADMNAHEHTNREKEVA
ncbi:MAG: single-stranded-DNA-specific exonuclease RecJ [Pseudomonadota bacterium]